MTRLRSVQSALPTRDSFRIAPTGRRSSNPFHEIPKPLPHRSKHIAAGAAAVSLTAREMAELDAALAPEKVAGRRYGETMRAQLDR